MDNLKFLILSKKNSKMKQCTFNRGDTSIKIVRKTGSYKKKKNYNCLSNTQIC